MFVLLLILHLLVCIGLIGVVLLQSGKGGGLAGGAFGGSAQTVFGGRGATDFITRATMVLGAAFFATSLALALMTSNGGPRATRSLIQEEAKRTGTVPPPATLPSSGPPGAPSGTPGAPSAPAPAPGGQPPSGGQPSGAPTQPPANPAPPGGTRPPGSPP